MARYTLNQTSALSPTEGHIIAGTPLDDNRFVGRIKASQLFQIAPDPRKTEGRDLKAGLPIDMQGVRAVRLEVQRLFEGAKRRNVVNYAHYIEAMHSGAAGLTPPITLYCSEPLKSEQHPDGTGYLQIPFDARLVAIDGETQLAARHAAAAEDPETRHAYVAIYIVHGRSSEWARQAFHDLNTLGVKPNAAISLGMDARDPYTAIARVVEKSVPLFAGKVSKTRRQISATDPELMTITSLRAAVVTLALGIKGVQYGARPVPASDEASADAIEAAAVDWFTAIAETFPHVMNKRAETLLLSPGVLAALGAVGHPLVALTDPKARVAKLVDLIKPLRKVNWNRDETWAGIAGKVTPSGRFSVGGSGKETAYAIFKALTDPSDKSFQQVRTASPDKPAAAA